MEHVRTRTRWVVAVVVATLAVGIMLLAPWSASATSGNPQLSLNLSLTGPGNKQILGSGTYSDPQGVCVISGKTVSWEIHQGSAGGTIVQSGTATTDGSGNYSFGPSITLSNNTTYFVKVTVLGSLSGGYGAGDQCADVSTTQSIAT